MIVLSKKFEHNEQAFEIFVKYDEVTKRPVEVKTIRVQINGSWYPIGNILTRYFKDAVWQLITGADWEKVREESKGNLLKDLHPIFQQLLRPHLLPCGPVLNN